MTIHVRITAQIKPKNRLNREGTLFLPGADAPRVYVRAWTLCCFHSLFSTETFGRALTASVGSCAKIKSAPPVA